MKLLVEDLSARHPAAKPAAQPALQQLNLALARGEQLAVIGPSGAGKTTLMQALACAHRPSQGRVLLDDTNPWLLPTAALQKLRGRLFLAPQAPPLPPRQRGVTSVLAARLPALGLWASVRSLFYPHDIAAAFEALQRFDLAEKLFERVDRLSGGERQRVGLARALLAPAQLWLVDEPLSALDPTRARQATATLVAEARKRGVTLVATLHQVDMALAHFPRIVGLREGRLQFDLPTAQVGRGLLESLYAQHENELRGETTPAAEPEPAAPAPVVMHCR